MLSRVCRGAVCALVLIPAAGHAQDEHPAHIHLSGIATLQLDSLVNAPFGSTHDQILSSTSELDVGIDMPYGLSLESAIHYDPSDVGGGDHYLSNQVVFADTLLLKYTAGNFSLMAGKLDPVFGTAWDVAPGIYGPEVAYEYQLTERVGFGGDVNIGSLLGREGTGEYILSASVYKTDTSFLSNSLVTRRGRLRHSDGGASNTRGLDSFTIALDGAQMKALPGLSYHIGLSSQAPGTDGFQREKGLVGGVSYALDTASGVHVDFLAELAHLWHANGARHDDLSFATFGASTAYKEWTVSMVFSGRFEKNAPVAPGSPDHTQLQLSIAHSLVHDITLEAGWKQGWDGNRKSGTFGILLSYAFE